MDRLTLYWEITNMSTATAIEAITLYYRQGNSDKVYQCAIEPDGPGYTVTFAFGRRGSTLSTGAKTAQPVGFDEARKLYDKLVREKTAKGYTPGESGTPYQQTSKSGRATGIVPQLCNPIDEAEAVKLLSDAAWLTQEKLDGKRLLIQRRGDAIIGVTRNGLTVGLPQPVARCAAQIPGGHFLIDGECIGEGFIAFDLLEYAGMDLRGKPYHLRLERLYGLPKFGAGQPIGFVQSAVKTARKQSMLADLRRQNKEGIVFKRIAAPHSAGRPASGGDWRKFKFTATASCIVSGTNGSKRSVKLALLDKGQQVGVGSVTIPPSVDIPRAGSVIEVRYLYAYEGGALYQPVYLARRDDIPLADCRLSQLKLRAADDSDCA
jgi:bifunctional non-homologous end joining protein LigD